MKRAPVDIPRNSIVCRFAPASRVFTKEFVVSRDTSRLQRRRVAVAHTGSLEPRTGVSAFFRFLAWRYSDSNGRLRRPADDQYRDIDMYRSSIATIDIDIDGTLSIEYSVLSILPVCFTADCIDRTCHY